MTNAEFAAWVRGYVELCPQDTLTPGKLQIIRNHLNLVSAVDGQLDGRNEECFRRITAALNDLGQQDGLEDVQKFLRASFGA
jgi:hypothetical protein